MHELGFGEKLIVNEAEHVLTFRSIRQK